VNIYKFREYLKQVSLPVVQPTLSGQKRVGFTFVTRSATRSCRTRKRSVRVYSPGVAAAATALLLLQLTLLLLTLLRTAIFVLKS